MPHSRKANIHIFKYHDTFIGQLLLSALRDCAPPCPVYFYKTSTMEPHTPADLDPDSIANLRALGDEGDDSFLQEIIGIYLEDTPLRLDDLRKAVETGDHRLYTRTAHTIKGSSSNVGAMIVRGLAEQLEHRSKVEEPASLEPLRAELEVAYKRAARALMDLLPRS